MLTNIRYILITALRDWLFVDLLAAVIMAVMISGMLGGTAMIEEQEMILTFAAGSARVILMIGLIVFVCFHIRNAFDTKEIDVMLSRPISRANLVIAYWLGFANVALLLAVPVVGIIGIIGIKNAGGYIGWGISLLMEAGMVVALALFSALTLRSAVAAVLACMGFYVLSRMMAFFMVAANSLVLHEQPYLTFRYILEAISVIVPRLDFYAQSDWLIYGLDSSRDWMAFVGQTAVFIPLLLLASIADFRRRQF